MSIPYEIDRGLSYADVALDADKYAVERTSGIQRAENLLDFGGIHGEEGLVDMASGLYTTGYIEVQLWAVLAEARSVLGGGDDGEVENLAFKYVSNDAEDVPMSDQSQVAPKMQCIFARSVATG